MPTHCRFDRIMPFCGSVDNCVISAVAGDYYKYSKVIEDYFI